MRSLPCRPLALAGPACVAGVALTAAPAGWIGICAGVLVAGCLVRRSRTLPLALAALLAGFLAGHRARARVRRSWPRAPPRLAQCDLDVVDCGEDPMRRRAWLRGRRPDGTGVLCHWPGPLPDRLGRGARVHVAGRFFLPRPASNPGQRDSRADLARRGVQLLSDLQARSNLKILRGAPFRLRSLLARARLLGARRLARVLPPDVAPLALALLLGIRSGVEPADRMRFVRTGTIHLLAISGMHLLLLAGLMHMLLRWSGLGPRTAAGITLALALAYVPVTGSAPPIRRAATVLCFYGFALVRGRPPDIASALGGAAVALALSSPLEVFRIGFRLSFAAAAGIAWLARIWQLRWGRRHRLLARFPAVRADRPVRLVVIGYLLRAFPVSLAAWCATQALVAEAFGSLTPAAPLVNILVAPVVALLLPCLVLLTAGMDCLAAPVVATVHALRGLLDAAAVLPFGYLRILEPSLAAVFFWLLGCALLRARVRLGAASMGLAVALACTAPGPREPVVALLDVGHGQAALVRFDDGASVLIDAGSRGRRALAARVVVPALRALGVRRLAAVVCTHADADHWNALPEIMAQFAVQAVLVGPSAPPIRFGRIPATRLLSGTVIHAGRWTRLTALAVSGRGSSNDQSLVLLFEAAGRRVLFPADREERGLLRLLESGLPPCEVLVAPHHGGACEVAARLGRAVRPRWLLVSANRNFADAETLAAYGAAKTLTTARLGCLFVRFPQPGAIEVSSFSR